MQSIKCVVCGDGTVGKTCLLIAYTMKAFPRDYVPTVFDNYNAVVEWDGRLVNIGLWDTAGQDDFEKMRPISYSNADIFLYFFSIASPTSFQNVKHKWYPEIEAAKRHPDIPTILVGNKADVRADEAALEEMKAEGIKPVSYKEGKQLAKELGCLTYVECSALKQVGFMDIFGQTIAAIINGRKGKVPGKNCWDTMCDCVWKKSVPKRGKCFRCQHVYCYSTCLDSLPKDHPFRGKKICKHCQLIEEKEPLRAEYRKGKFWKRKARAELILDSSDDEKELDDSDKKRKGKKGKGKKKGGKKGKKGKKSDKEDSEEEEEDDGGEEEHEEEEEEEEEDDNGGSDDEESG